MKLAEYKDLRKIINILNDGKKALRKDGIDQWQNGLPNEEDIRDDISKKEGYIYENKGEILAYTQLKKSYEKDYEDIEKNFKNHEKPLTIHRLCVKASAKNRGLASLFMEEIINYAKNKNIDSLRIDTHEDNFKLRGLLRKFNFSLIGECFVDDRIKKSKRKVYELALC